MINKKYISYFNFFEIQKKNQKKYLKFQTFLKIKKNF